uniref:Adhesion G protein-coupled receptor G1 n=1 Tax=Coturnix japonica TaxID=93934 RepID=A0A8C2TLA5_COTJA
MLPPGVGRSFKSQQLRSACARPGPFPPSPEFFHWKEAHGAREGALPLSFPRSILLCLTQDEHNSSVLHNHILGAFLHNRTVGWLRRPVEIRFRHDKDSNATCVFWQPAGTGSAGSWSREGCETKHQEGTVRCLCNHLTYFAVLLLQSLTYISTVGCSISAAAAFCTLLCGAEFFSPHTSRSKQRDQITSMHIHMNLLGAIFLLDFTFLVSEHLASSSSQAACRAGGLFLHFSLLSCLTWMGIEGYNLYRLVIEVFNAYHDHFLLKLCLVGWGLWVRVEVGCFILFLTRRTSLPLCWLTSPMIHNVVNLGFFSVVFLFNLVMLGAMVREILRQNKKGHKLKHVLALFGLSILLGIPWALVFFSFTSGVFRLVSLYIFTIVNSLQGVFIFIWLVVLYYPRAVETSSSLSHIVRNDRTMAVSQG